VVFTIALGVFPQSLLLSWMGPSVNQMVKAVTTADVLRSETGIRTAVAGRPWLPRAPISPRVNLERER
jgi:hypothetical protein